MPGGEGDAALAALLERVAGGDLRSVAAATLQAGCELGGWPVGRLYLPEGVGGAFVSSGVWVRTVEDFAALREFTADADIVGRAAADGRPVWSGDADRDGRGVGTTLAVPVVASGRVVAVLVFFSPRTVEPDESLTQVLTGLGHRLEEMADPRQVDAEAHAARQRLEQAIETSVEAFVSIDADGRIIAWNSAAERMFGLPREEALGRILHETIVPERYRDADRAGRERFLATGRSHVLGRRLELAALRADGGEFPAEVVVWATREGPTWTFSAFIHDISDRRRAEEALRRAYAQEQATVARLRELDQAKDGFIETVSHELRTPLTTIMGYLEMLTGDDIALEDDQRQRMLAAVNHNAMRLHRLVEDLLAVNTTFHGVLAAEPVAVTVREIIDEAVQGEFAETWCARHPVTVHVDDGADWVYADRDLLVRALNCVLSNAAKFSSGGAPITVHASSTGGDVAIAVTDRGFGIATEDLPRVFDRFFRTRVATERAIQGVGLGLHIAKTMVEAGGGTVSVTSAPGEGSTFTLTLPGRAAETDRPDG